MQKPRKVGRKIVAYLEKVTKKGRGRRIAKVMVVVRKGRIVRGEIIADVDKDGRPDRVTFWRRKRGSGYAANVSISSQKKRQARKRK